MTLPRHLRVSSLLLLTLLLVAGPLAAATSGSRRSGPSGLSVTGMLSQAWAFVSRIWGKAGGSSDPFGNPTPSALAPSHGGSTESQPAPGN